MVHLNLKGITLLPLDRVMALNTWSHESVSPPGGPHPPRAGCTSHMLEVSNLWVQRECHLKSHQAWDRGARQP